jgi:hypothetical protein
MELEMARKNKVQIYIPVKEDWESLVEKLVGLRRGEGKEYTPWLGMNYTTSEVVIDAMKELARRIEETDGKV